MVAGGSCFERDLPGPCCPTPQAEPPELGFSVSLGAPPLPFSFPSFPFFSRGLLI